MQKLISLLLLLVCSQIAFSQEVKVNANVTEATVFLQGAQLVMRADASIQPGINIIKISKLPPLLDQNSLQVKGDGNFTIQSVNFQVNYLDSLDESKERETLQKKLEDIKLKIEDLRNQSDIIVAKDVYLRENRVVGGKDAPLSPDSYQKLYELYCKFVSDEKNEWFSITRKISNLEKESQKIQNQLNERASKMQGKSTGEVLIAVSSKNAQTGKFQLSFLVNDAGWSPSYDIRVDKLDQPVSLVYKANVYQRSGLDWKNIRLTLSNSNPFTSGVLPILNPYYLRFMPVYTYQPTQAPVSMQEVQVAGVRKAKIPAAADQGGDYVFQETANYNQAYMSENQTNVEFEVEGTYSVASDGKPQMMELQRIEMPASFIYQAVPKMEKEGFLTARIRDWEQYNLLDGPTNLYFENSYVGKSDINLGAISDTLTLSMGRDRSVVISRTKIKDFTQKQFIGGNRLETRQWEIGIKNNKSQKISLQMKDQVPVSTNQDIVVDIQELSGGSLNKDTGEVTWNLDLNAKESKKLTLKYTVKYPKNQKVVIE